MQSKLLIMWYSLPNNALTAAFYVALSGQTDALQQHNEQQLGGYSWGSLKDNSDTNSIVLQASRGTEQ